MSTQFLIRETPVVVGSYYWMLFSDDLLAWENSRDSVWVTSTEIPDWWCATSKIWLPPPQTFYFAWRRARNANEWCRGPMDCGKGEKKIREAKVSPVSSCPPSFVRKFFIEREASAYEAEDLSTATSFFLRSFFRRHFAGKPVVASRNAAVSSG